MATERQAMVLHRDVHGTGSWQTWHHHASPSRRVDDVKVVLLRSYFQFLGRLQANMTMSRNGGITGLNPADRVS